MNLTHRQSEIYRFLQTHIRERGYPPTVREIGQRFGIKSANGVYCHLLPLRKKGFIDWEPTLSRSIRLLKTPGEAEMMDLEGVIHSFGDLFQEGNVAIGTAFGHAVYNGKRLVGTIRRF